MVGTGRFELPTPRTPNNCSIFTAIYPHMPFHALEQCSCRFPRIRAQGCFPLISCHFYMASLQFQLQSNRRIAPLKKTGPSSRTTGCPRRSWPWDTQTLDAQRPSASKAEFTIESASSEAAALSPLDRA
jgi:hypothetical protein